MNITKDLLFAFNIGSAFAALIAALLWFKASRLTVPPDRSPDKDGSYPALITLTTDDGKEIDPFTTAIQASRVNAKAAIAAAIAALLQGLDLLFTAWAS